MKKTIKIEEKIKRILFFLLIFWGTNVFSQTSLSLPQLTTPSPKATMMNRFGNYPVSLYTGLVDITIPIHTINTSDITVPIEFKYHASGLKYDDIPMELGYGWTLIAGGTVSYSVRGTPEGKSLSGSGQKANPYVWIREINQIQRYQNTGPAHENTDQSKLTYLVNGAKQFLYDAGASYSDSEYDVYSYNFLNHIGRTYVLDGSVINVPANGIPVSRGLYAVTDHDGISYKFEIMEYDFYDTNETWYLTEIVSADKTDTVRFNYTYPSQFGVRAERPIIDQTFVIKEGNYNPLDGGTGYPEIEFGYNLNYAGATYKVFFPPRLNYIQYRGGKVEFSYANAATLSLKEIKIYNSSGNLLKTVTLQKPRTDWLDKIDFKDGNGTNQYSYSFEYDGTPNRSGIDYWGYFNGTGNNTYPGFYIPDFTITVNSPSGFKDRTLPGMSRTPNLNYMQKGMLTKIIYPTKGYSKFIYEAHKAVNTTYGGLRIKEIQNYDENNNLVEKKWYKYGANESGNGRAVSFISTKNDRIFSEEYRSLTPIIELKGSMDNALRIHGETLYYTYLPFPKASYFESGSSVLYPEVAEYSGTGSVSNGKTVYKYSDTPDETRPTYRGGRRPSQKYRTNEWKNGLLLNKTSYDGNNNVVYSLTNNYDLDSFYSEALNLCVTPYCDIMNYGGIIGNYQLDILKTRLGYSLGIEYEIAQRLDGTLFDYYNYYITTGLPILTSTVETVNGVMKRTAYSGHNNLGLPAEKSEEYGHATYVTKYKYAMNYPNTEPYKTMIANNRLTPVIEQSLYKGATFLSKNVTDYKNWGNNLIAPEYVKIQATPNTSLETRITYHNRDSHGNPLYINKDGAEKVVYLWGYNYQYPIAEIHNATYSDIVPGKITETMLKTIAEKNEPSTSDWSLIEGLRTSLPQAYITTYKYKPLIGLVWMKDPSEVVTVYDYDNLGRLKIIRDNDNNPIEEYKYHYKN
jgi:hypothetical protein